MKLEVTQMANNNSNEYLVPKVHAYYVFILLFLLYLFDQADRYVITALFPFFKAEWGITDTQCGLLVSAVYWSLLIFVFPTSLLIDRWSRKHAIGVMAVVWSLASAASAFTRNFGQLFATRTAIGIGEAGYAPGGAAMISGLFPEKKRSIYLGIWMASVPLGAAAGVMLGGLIATQYGWRHAFGILAVPGLILGLMFFFVKDYKTVQLVKTDQDAGKEPSRVKMKARDIVREFSSKPSLILTYLAFAGNVFAQVALLTWMPTYFQRAAGMSVAASSVNSGLIMLAALIGIPLGGYIADRWYRRRKDARLLFCAISSCVTAVFFFLAFIVPVGPMQFALLVVVGITIAAYNPGAAAVTQDVVHPGLRAISYSLCVVAQHILGSTLGPIFVGAVSDAYDIQTALSILPVFILASAVMFFIASRLYEKDLVKVERITLQADN
jgi:MFS family permease